MPAHIHTSPRPTVAEGFRPRTVRRAAPQSIDPGTFPVTVDELASRCAAAVRLAMRGEGYSPSDREEAAAELLALVWERAKDHTVTVSAQRPSGLGYGRNGERGVTYSKRAAQKSLDTTDRWANTEAVPPHFCRMEFLSGHASNLRRAIDRQRSKDTDHAGIIAAAWADPVSGEFTGDTDTPVRPSRAAAAALRASGGTAVGSYRGARRVLVTAVPLPAVPARRPSRGTAERGRPVEVLAWIEWHLVNSERAAVVDAASTKRQSVVSVPARPAKVSARGTFRAAPPSPHSVARDLLGELGLPRVGRCYPLAYTAARGARAAMETDQPGALIAAELGMSHGAYRVALTRLPERVPSVAKMTPHEHAEALSLLDGGIALKPSRSRTMSGDLGDSDWRTRDGLAHPVSVRRTRTVKPWNGRKTSAWASALPHRTSVRLASAARASRARVQALSPEEMTLRRHAAGIPTTVR